jgi:hypothetical protein
MKDEKSLQEIGMTFIGVRKGCRWSCDQPKNGQVQDWTSFEILVVKDQEGIRWWCRNYYNRPWWGNNTFIPLPEGAKTISDEELPEKLAFWNQNQLKKLEDEAK